MVLAINTITSITLVAVRMVRIMFVVTILPLLGAFVEAVNVNVLEMGTIAAFRWISVCTLCAIRGLSVAPPQLPP